MVLAEKLLGQVLMGVVGEKLGDLGAIDFFEAQRKEVQRRLKIERGSSFGRFEAQTLQTEDANLHPLLPELLGASVGHSWHEPHALYPGHVDLCFRVCETTHLIIMCWQMLGLMYGVDDHFFWYGPLQVGKFVGFSKIWSEDDARALAEPEDQAWWKNGEKGKDGKGPHWVTKQSCA